MNPAHFGEALIEIDYDVAILCFRPAIRCLASAWRSGHQFNLTRGARKPLRVIGRARPLACRLGSVARLPAQPLEIAQVICPALRERHDVVALAILGDAPAGLACVLVPALDRLYQPAPWPAASAPAPAARLFTDPSRHQIGRAHV